MRPSFAFAALLAVTVGPLLTTAAMAQAPPARRSGTAVVDMAAIMKGANRFNAAMEKLKAQYEAKAEELKKDGERGNQLTEQLRALPQNSPQRKEMEDSILRLRADYELKGKRITEEIRDSESKLVLGLVGEVRGELERYGQATGTQLILRANPVPPNLNDPRIILQEIHKPIVYQAPNVDATTLILDAMNRGAPSAPPAGAGAAPTANRAAPPAARR
jgi:Skp family chaperone for outer membrane proteins